MPIPQYAQSTPRHLLVKYLCKSRCGTSRYRRVSKFPWSREGVNQDPDLYVTCLKCGGKQYDKYNWVPL